VVQSVEGAPGGGGGGRLVWPVYVGTTGLMSYCMKRCGSCLPWLCAGAGGEEFNARWMLLSRRLGGGGGGGEVCRAI